MRILPVIILFSLLSGLTHAQSPFKWVQGENGGSVRWMFNGYQNNKLTGTEAISVTCKDCTPRLETGAPDLGKTTTSIIIPSGSSPDFEISDAAFIEIENVNVAPSKGNLSRQIDPSRVAFAEGDVYTRNQFYPQSIVELRDPFSVGSINGTSIVLTPFQYNPVTKVLRIYYRIDISIQFTATANPQPNDARHASADPEFSATMQRQFLNYEEGRALYPALTDAPGRMLIICHSAFMDEMTPFVEWKKQKGIEVDLVDIATVGDGDAIKNYVAGYYNTFGLQWLLLVGDAELVPTYYGVYGWSDNQYAFITGSDFYPDIFVGRFSAETEAEVTTQVNRVLRYEKNPPMAGDWYTTGLCVASDQGPGDDNEMDYEHSRNIRAGLLNYNYSSVHELYDGTQGGTDLPGDPTAEMFAAKVEEGLSLINYTGHGSDFACSTTGMSTTEVDALNNADQYPFFIAVACVNGNFVGQTCFAESWLRATTDNGEPAGAIATMMSTINQSWDPPMEGQDEMNHLLTETVAGNVPHTFGGIAMNGCMKMNETYGGAGNEMTETWTLFGDPSVMIRTLPPVTMVVTHRLLINAQSTALNVNCDTEGAFVSLTVGNEIIATATVSGGIASLLFDPLQTTDDLLVTVTAYNRRPYQSTILVSGTVDVAGEFSTLFETFPNPFSGTLHLRNVDHQELELQLATVQGQVLRMIHLPANSELSLDMSELAPGSYFLLSPSGSRRLVKLK